ncbi:uncharacterized protein LOC118182741 [Stegodyphus dumicola]|uniref:uncharacterized protein LOC118182741 n=1 Tax=Stegodyphus dumicola TaxID=202533 RepID=UPI0015AF2A4D|nr:uncharacterized protein LOC118182741 [Stegodyphus dumicola]
MKSFYFIQLVILEVLLACIISDINCTLLAAAGYLASAYPIRNFLINTGVSGKIRLNADSLYHASGLRSAGDQGTDIRKAYMKNHDIVEVGSDKSFRKRSNYTYSQAEGRIYSERLFGVLNQMDKNTCIARLLCEIGSNPKSFGVIGLKINHYIQSVPPVTWNSATFPYIESFRAGLQNGRQLCLQHYSSCTYDLKRVMKYLWYFINPLYF